jgi:hypothetical protein
MKFFTNSCSCFDIKEEQTLLFPSIFGRLILNIEIGDGNIRESIPVKFHSFLGRMFLLKFQSNMVSEP